MSSKSGGTRTSLQPNIIWMIFWRMPTLSKWRSWMVPQVRTFVPSYIRLINRFLLPFQPTIYPFISHVNNFSKNSSSELWTLFSTPSPSDEHPHAGRAGQHHPDPHPHLAPGEGPLRQDDPQDGPQGHHGPPCRHLSQGMERDRDR